MNKDVSADSRLLPDPSFAQLHLVNRMNEFEVLKQTFEKPGISLVRGPGELTTVTLEHEGASARVCRHGAHVLDYRPRDQAAVLWLSPQAVFETAKPIRGGIPICWPWFAEHAHDAALPAHGFARIADWTIVASASRDAEKSVTLGLRDNAGTRAMWDQPFELSYRVSLAEQLHASLCVTNTGSANMRYSAALHSYFNVLDVERISLEGLAERSYLDKVDEFRCKSQHETLLRFAGETDRIYLDTTAPCTIYDDARERRIRVRKMGSRTTVVWNPWAGRARQLDDFPDDGYRRMLCVESANAVNDLVDLAPGASHTLSVSIESEDT